LLTSSEAALLRRLARGDPGSVDDPPRLGSDPTDIRRAHEEAEAILRAAAARIGALVALDAGVMCYQHEVNEILAAGGSPRQVLEALLAVADTVGVARVIASTPRIALALGLDIEPTGDDEGSIDDR
jgi:alkylhydroperoxidase family enzyme